MHLQNLQSCLAKLNVIVVREPTNGYTLRVNASFTMRLLYLKSSVTFMFVRVVCIVLNLCAKDVVFNLCYVLFNLVFMLLILTLILSSTTLHNIIVCLRSNERSWNLQACSL